MQSTLSSKAKARLKGNNRLLNPKKEDYLSTEKQQELNEILGYSPLLQAVYLWKEAFGEWYHSPNAKIAGMRLDSWLEQGEQIAHPAIVACLKTIRNWRLRNRKLPPLSLDQCDCRGKKQSNPICTWFAH